MLKRKRNDCFLKQKRKHYVISKKLKLMPAIEGKSFSALKIACKIEKKI